MLYIGIIFIIAAVDLWVKEKVASQMGLGEKRHSPMKQVLLWHIKNKGVAYNHLEGRKKCILIATGGMIGYIIYILAKEPSVHENTIARLSLSALLGGAIGNFLERIKFGYVTDYIYIKAKGMPIFNIADVFIFAGSVIFCLSSVFRKEKL